MCHHAPKENGTAQNKSEHQRPQNEHTEHRTKNNINILTWWKSQNVHIARFDSSFGIVTLDMPNYCLKNAEKKQICLKTNGPHESMINHAFTHASTQLMESTLGADVLLCSALLSSTIQSLIVMLNILIFSLCFCFSSLFLSVADAWVNNYLSETLISFHFILAHSYTMLHSGAHRSEKIFSIHVLNRFCCHWWWCCSASHVHGKWCTVFWCNIIIGFGTKI